MFDKLAFIKKLVPFSALPDEDLEDLVRRGHWHEATKGTLLFQKDDAVQSTILLYKGRVKLTRTTATGADAVLNVIEAPALIINTLPLYLTHTSEAVVIDAHTQLFYLPAEALQKALFACPQATQALAQHIAEHLQRQEGRLEHLMVQNTTQRIGCYLLQTYRKQGQNPIHLDLEKATIAAHLGMQPETLSRALTHLKKVLGVEVTGNRVTIPDVNRLAAYVCQHCSHLYPCKTITL